MRWVQAFDRWFYTPMSAERLASLRILVGAASLAYLVGFGFEILAPLAFDPRRFRPVGVATWLDGPLSDASAVALYLACVILSIPFLLGAWHRLAGPAFALALLSVATYRNSWGMVFHTENLMVLHALALAVAPAADAWSWDASRRAATEAVENVDPRRYGSAVRTLCMMTVAVYFVAGVAKLRYGGVGWIAGDVLRAHVAYDNLLKIETGGLSSSPGIWLVRQGRLFTLLAVLTIALELLAPLALAGRRLARTWVLTAWAFHLGVLAFMAIGFAYPVSGIAFASFFDTEAAWRRARSTRLVARLESLVVRSRTA